MPRHPTHPYERSWALSNAMAFYCHRMNSDTLKLWIFYPIKCPHSNLFMSWNLWSLNFLDVCMGSLLVRSNILERPWPHLTYPTLHLGSSNSKVAPLGLHNNKLPLNQLNCWSTCIEPLHSFKLTSPSKWYSSYFNLLWSTQSTWASLGPLDDYLISPIKLNEHK